MLTQDLSRTRPIIRGVEPLQEWSESPLKGDPTINQPGGYLSGGTLRIKSRRQVSGTLLGRNCLCQPKLAIYPRLKDLHRSFDSQSLNSRAPLGHDLHSSPFGTFTKSGPTRENQKTHKGPGPTGPDALVPKCGPYLDKILQKLAFVSRSFGK